MSGISIIGYLILTVSIGYAFLYPAMGELNGLTAEKEKYEASLEMAGNIESKKNELLTEFNNISPEDKKDIETIMPSSLNFVRLVSQIDSVAAKHGISIGKITLKENDVSVGETIEGASPQKPYQSSTVGFSFVSSYEKFNDFQGELEKSLRILDVRSVKIKAEEKGVYSFSVEFETYWLK